MTEILAARIAGVWSAEFFNNDIGFPLEVVLADELLRNLSQQESACFARLPNAAPAFTSSNSRPCLGVAPGE